MFLTISPDAGGAPLYRVAKRALLQAIEAGQCPPGSTLPNESSLASFELTRLDEEAAAALRLRSGEAAIEINNRLSLQGRPIVHDRLLLPSALFKGLTEKRLRERPSTIYHLYQTEFAITVVRAEERLRACAADRAAARILGVAPGAPVLQVRRTALTFNDKPVEFRVSTLNSAQHDYVNLVSRP